MEPRKPSATQTQSKHRESQGRFGRDPAEVGPVTLFLGGEKKHFVLAERDLKTWKPLRNFASWEFAERR
jgi:hypothetical protein